MLGDLPKLLCLVLAFSLVSCTVAPVFVFAEDAVTITNVARSSVSTGGQDGQDGADGADGHDGAPGASGKAGVSVSNYASGEAGIVSDVHSVVEGEGTAFSQVNEVVVAETISTASSAASDSATETAPATTGEVAPEKDAPDEPQPLAQLFAELKLIIFTYVSYLF